MNIKQRLVIACAAAPPTPARMEAGLSGKKYNDPLNLVKPVNEIASTKFDEKDKIVIFGGGKTALDSLLYLVREKKVAGSQIYVIVPSPIYFACRDFLYKGLHGAEITEENVRK